MNGHLDVDALDRYRRRVASPGELLLVDAHIASCGRCYAAVASELDSVTLPPADNERHLTYEELEAFVDARADATDRELVEGHTALCDLCRDELAGLTRVRDAMPPPPCPRPAGRMRREGRVADDVE